MNGKYTMVWESPIGLAVSHITIEKLWLEEYAQFKNSLVMHYKEKGKRKLKALRYYDDMCKAFIEGWHEVETLEEAKQKAECIYYGGHKGFNEFY